MSIADGYIAVLVDGQLLRRLRRDLRLFRLLLHGREGRDDVDDLLRRVEHHADGIGEQIVVLEAALHDLLALDAPRDAQHALGVQLHHFAALVLANHWEEVE